MRGSDAAKRHGTRRGGRGKTGNSSLSVPISELGEALMRREPWAARAVMLRLQPSVERLLARMLGEGPEVEDVSQEVFLRLFARIDSLEEPASLRAYVHAIAVRVGCWELRRRAVRRIVSLSDCGAVPDGHEQVWETEPHIDVLRLGEILGELGTTERRVFVLRRIERRTLAEIAEVLGVSLSTVKRRVARVIPRIDRVLAREPGLVFADRAEDLEEGTQRLEPRAYSSVA